MAPPPSGSVALLRATTFRISSTPVKQLPSVTTQITGAIWNCRDLLSTPTDAKQNSETSVVIHRFKTQLSTLLQERTIEGRWAAVVLVKSTIEAGGIEVLAKSNAWVKSLLGILKKPDPPTTRGLAVLVLTRIFMLTWDYSNLVREITTPALTAFVPTCLSNIDNKRCSASELETVLEAFSVLLPRHPTIFRSNESRLRIYLSNILSSNSTTLDSASHYSKACRDVASRLMVQLHSCAPKQGASDKWADTMKAVTTAAHATCDRIFRAVQEDWRTTSGVTTPPPSHILGGDVESESDDDAGLKPWKGIYAGGERLISLLELIQSHLMTATSGSVSVRIGVITDLLTRILAVTLPHSSNKDFVKINAQVSKDEREAMYAVLPNIHVAALDLCNSITRRFGNELTGWTLSIIERILPIFRAERSIAQLRMAAYIFLSSVLIVNGPSMSRTEVAELSLVLDMAVVDVSPCNDATASASAQNSNGIKQQLGMAGSNGAQSHPTETTGIFEAAADLLRTALERLDAVCIPAKIRTQIDRIAVTSRNEHLLFASVLNPHRKQNDARVQPSLLPILAREFGDLPQVEALLRPRMPPIGTKQEEHAEENDEQEVDQEDESMHDEDGFDTAVESPEDHTTAQVSLEQQVAPAQDKTDTVIASKRPATEDVTSSSSAKRFRASPVAESLMPDAASTLPAPDPANAEEDVPSTVVLPGTSEETVTAFQSDANSIVAGAGADDEGSDDSDDAMVVPLTMEDSDADDGE